MRRRLTALGRAVAAAFGPIGNSVCVEIPRLAFWQGLPASARAYLADDIKLMIGWTFDAAACGASLAPSPVIDARSGFERVPGFAAPTPMQGLVGRYRVLRAFDHGRGYYGIASAALEGSDRVIALLLLNRLFRMPIAHRDPLGLVTDVVTNGAMLAGLRTNAVADAESAAESAYGDAVSRGVPLIAGGQSQAGGTAQLQAAQLQKQHPGGVPIGFVTLNAAHVLVSVRRLGLDGGAVDGINFSKDLDPGVGPKGLFANRVGFQVYIHRDGSGSRRPGDTTLLDAVLHPREHFLDSFTAVSLTDALASALAGP